MSNNFNEKGYLAANSDVAADPWFSKNALEHYTKYGKTEGRSLGLQADTANPWENMQPQQQPYQAPQFGRNENTRFLADALTEQSNQNLSQNVMPGISQGAQLAGQYGGSRQGVAEGIAAGNAQSGLNASIAGLYSQAYGQDQNFYTQQRGQDQDGVRLGADLYGMGNSGNLGIGSGQYSLGKAYQDAPMNALEKYQGVVAPYTNAGGGTNSSSSSTTTNYGSSTDPVGGKKGSNWQDIAGGAMAGYQTARNLGLGGSSGGSIGGGGYTNNQLGLSGSGGYQAGGGYGSVPYGISK